MYFEQDSGGSGKACPEPTFLVDIDLLIFSKPANNRVRESSK